MTPANPPARNAYWDQCDPNDAADILCFILSYVTKYNDVPSVSLTSNRQIDVSHGVIKDATRLLNPPFEDEA